MPCRSPNQADTLTVGVVWTPEFAGLKAPFFSIDYYDIKINDYISEFGAQEVLDSCYEAGIDSECAKIHAWAAR